MLGQIHDEVKTITKEGLQIELLGTAYELHQPLEPVGVELK